MYYTRKKALTFCTRPRQEHFGQALVRVGVWTACGVYFAALVNELTGCQFFFAGHKKNTDLFGVYNGAPGRIARGQAPRPRDGSDRLRRLLRCARERTYRLSVLLRRAQKNTERVGVFNGAPGRIRTYNLLIRSQMLYPIELRAHRGNNTTPFFFRMQAFFIKIRKNYQIIPRFILARPPIGGTFSPLF